MTKLLDVKHLKKYYPVKSNIVRRVIGYYKAVDDISFYINEGETFGLVGESGCGKTTVGKSIIRLIEPTDGEILFKGENIRNYNEKELQKCRRNMQIIFQDPYGSLNPRMSIRDIIGEPLKKHRIAAGADCTRRVEELLSVVGISKKEIDKYPHEFSGGQRQRICIARALGLNPKLIVCDEPVSALDVSVQAQILNLLHDLQTEYKLSYLFIAHGMPAVRHISHRVAVMYLGKIVEIGERDTIFDSCLHPYTKALMSAIPVADPDMKTQFIPLEGEVPDLMDPPANCLFCSRCPYADDHCRTNIPELREISPHHYVACHHV
ncbi:MAG: ABC transporter ATP-binding protein [Anaerolineaceae bacterium]|nr:ABC transporter ATP-binding protein [Anaerolineaceae bacterium]